MKLSQSELKLSPLKTTLGTWCIQAHIVVAIINEVVRLIGLAAMALPSVCCSGTTL